MTCGTLAAGGNAISVLVSAIIVACVVGVLASLAVAGMGLATRATGPRPTLTVTVTLRVLALSEWLPRNRSGESEVR